MVNIPQPLNRHSSIPLYRQLKRLLLAQIENSTYEDGQQLPSENEMVETYDVSRHVVRQALKALVLEGYVVARQGLGYFVNKKRIRKELPRLDSHTQSMAQLGLPTQTLVVQQEEVTPPNFVAERMLSKDEDKVVLIKRVTYLDGEPVSLIVAYYLPKYSKFLLDRDLDNQSIYATLKECCGLIPARTETVISVTFADEQQSSLLQIREGAPLLNIGSFTWSEEDELFEYSSGYYRADRFELELEKR